MRGAREVRRPAIEIRAIVILAGLWHRVAVARHEWPVCIRLVGVRFGDDRRNSDERIGRAAANRVDRAHAAVQGGVQQIVNGVREGIRRLEEEPPRRSRSKSGDKRLVVPAVTRGRTC